MRKPVFCGFDQVQHKPSCTTTEDGYRLEISYIGSRGIVLSLSPHHTDILKWFGSSVFLSFVECSSLTFSRLKWTCHRKSKYHFTPEKFYITLGQVLATMTFQEGPPINILPKGIVDYLVADQIDIKPQDRIDGHVRHGLETVLKSIIRFFMHQHCRGSRNLFEPEVARPRLQTASKM